MDSAFSQTVTDGNPTEAALRGLVRAASSLRYLDCLNGWLPDQPIPQVDLREPRVRAVRDHPRYRFMLRTDPLGRFWFRDWRHFVLFHALLRDTAWANGTARPLSVDVLARLSGLTPQTVGLVLKQARESGDFVLRSAAHDRRRLIAEPSRAVQELANWRRDAHTALLAAYVGRADPTPRLPPAARLAWRRFYIEQTFTMSADVGARPGHMLRRSFLFILWDLLLDGPQAPATYIPDAARRLLVSTQTIRNEISWLRQHGWIEPEETLVATPMAGQRFAAMMGTVHLRAHLELDLLEMLVARPALAGVLLPGR